MRKVMRNAARRLARTSLLLLCLGLATQAYAAGPDYDGLNSLLYESAGNNEAMCDAIRTLSRELARRPDDAELLRMRVNAYRSVGDYFSAKKDAEKLARMFPGFTPYRVLNCMLLESTGAAEKDYLACYRGVLSSFGSDSLKEKDPHGHVLVLLLAKAPEAEKLRRQYSQALTPEANGYNVTREQLLHFDRRAIVPRVEPGVAWQNPCSE